MDFKVRNAWPRRRMTAGVCMAILLRYTSDLNHQPPPCFPPFSLIVPMKERRINYGRIKKKKKRRYGLYGAIPPAVDSCCDAPLSAPYGVCYTHIHTWEKGNTSTAGNQKKIFHSTTLHFPILSFTKTLQNKTKNRSFSDWEFPAFYSVVWGAHFFR